MNATKRVGVTLFLALVLGSSAVAQDTAGSATAERAVDLSPRSWGEGELEEYTRLTGVFGGQNELATSERGVVTGTTSALAIRAGLEALLQGGSAADAVLTTSLTQIALAGGSWVSYAGIFTLVYYDAQSGEVYNLNAAYDTLRGEDDPLTIPRGSSSGAAAGEIVPSGRTALVPGYMAGVGAAHERFGKLPFDELLAPAIYLAEEGFVLHGLHASMIERRKGVLGRLAETRRVFTKEDGSFYGAGDLFRQPALAATLGKVSEEGVGYMYTGDWAAKFVELVGREGGKVSAEDLAGYEVIWSEPVRLTYGDFELAMHGLPAQGGAHLAEALQVAAQADLKGMGHYAESPEAFFWLNQITDLFALSFLAPPMASMMIGGGDTSLEARASAEHAERLWPLMRDGKCMLTSVPTTGESQVDDPKHSDAVVAIDRWGNVAALCHSINTGAWGDTGIFVDGVSIPDSASFQQQLIAQTGPGQRLPDPTEVLIVLRDGKPYAALSSIGSGLHQKTVSTLLNLLDFGMGIKEAVDAPSAHLPAYDPAGKATVQVFEGDFDETFLERVRALGLPVSVVPATMQSRAPRGYVVGARIDPETERREAVATDVLNAGALGE